MQNRRKPTQKRNERRYIIEWNPTCIQQWGGVPFMARDATAQCRTYSHRPLSEKRSGTGGPDHSPFASLSSNRTGSSGQSGRRGGCGAGRFVVSFNARGPVQGPSEDVHLAHDDRDQFCAYEVASTFTATANQFGRNISGAESFVWRISSRIPDQVRNTCIKTEKLQPHWVLQPPGYLQFCG